MPSLLMKFRGAIIVVIIAALLTLLMFLWMGYEFANFSTALVGSGEDTAPIAWMIYQGSDNLLHRPTDLGYSTIGYGEEASFAFTAAPYGIALFMLPLYVLSGSNHILVYNIYYLLTYILTALAVYLLVRYLLNVSRKIAVFVALLVTFSGYRLLQWDHINQMGTHLVVFSILALFYLMDKPNRQRAILLGLIVWLTTITDGYLWAMFMIAAAIILIYYVAKHTERLIETQLLQYLGIAGIIAVVLSAPFVAFRYQNEAFREGHDFEDSVEYSAKPSSWVSGNSAIYQYSTSSSTASEASRLFLGFTPLILAGLGWFYRKRNDDGQTEEQDDEPHAFSRLEIITIFGILTLTSYALTLGPVLKYKDERITVLPYAILMQLPGFSGMRVPARLIFLATLGTAVLAAVCLHWLSQKLRREHYTGVFGIVIVIAMIEFIPFNGSTSKQLSRAVRYPLEERLFHSEPIEKTLVAEWLDDQPHPTPVVHYPYWTNDFFKYQPYHNQPTLNVGFSTYLPHYVHMTDWSNPPDEVARQILYERGICYILVHEYLLSGEEIVAADVYFGERMANAGLLEFQERVEETEIYRVLQPIEQLRIEFSEDISGEGWRNGEDMITDTGESLTWTWTNEPVSTLELDIERDTDYQLEFYVINAIQPDILNSLEVELNGERLDLARADNEYGSLFSGGISSDMMGSENVLTFRVDRVMSPQEAGTGEDTATLGLAFDWLKISTIGTCE